MLLAVDIGNTNVTLGLFDGPALLRSWRLATVQHRTADEYGILVRTLLTQAGLDPASIRDVVLASVVPALTRTVQTMLDAVVGRPVLTVGPGVKTGVAVHYRPPTDVGADRVVNAVAAFERYRTACIVVDFGTATTFDCIGSKGDYLGGAIAPGVDLALSALLARAAKLPKVELVQPDAAIGKSTVASIQSGSFFGYVALVDGLVDRIRCEMGGPQPPVLATGGLARGLAEASRTIQDVDEDLTLRGLRLIHQRNTSRASAEPPDPARTPEPS
jgi:type III pantothenate kinase